MLTGSSIYAYKLVSLFTYLNSLIQVHLCNMRVSTTQITQTYASTIRVFLNVPVYNIFMHVDMNIYVYINISISIYIYTYVRTYLYIYIYICR